MTGVHKNKDDRGTLEEKGHFLSNSSTIVAKNHREPSALGQKKEGRLRSLKGSASMYDCADTHV